MQRDGIRPQKDRDIEKLKKLKAAHDKSSSAVADMIDLYELEALGEEIKDSDIDAVIGKYLIASIEIVSISSELGS